MPPDAITSTQPGSLDTPPITSPTVDAEPEGVVEVQGQKLVPLAALEAERKRAKETTEAKLRAEMEPFKQKAAEADRLAADLAAIQPHIDYLRQHPEILQRPSSEDRSGVTDDEAERYAREYELYTPQGLDLARAKRIIATHRADMQRVAQEAAQQAVQPVLQTTAVQAARQNFLWAASQKGPDGRPLVDPSVLANQWAKLPPELTANPDVAQWVLRAAIGEATVSGRQAPAAPSQEPTFTEAPGGASRPAYAMSDIERRVARSAGISEKDWTARAQTYQPDSVNVLGD